MTSDDTHARTVALLEKHANFGMAEGQVTIVKQEKVAALTDNDAHMALEEGDAYMLDTKPHGHGDVHTLLASSGLAAKWEGEGRKYIVFFQDTNSLAFTVTQAAIGVSIEQVRHDDHSSSSCCPQPAVDRSSSSSTTTFHPAFHYSCIADCVTATRLCALIADCVAVLCLQSRHSFSPRYIALCVQGFEVNSIAVPRKAKDAVGAITKLVRGDGTSITVNVEYNQLEPLLKASGHAEGDVNDATGFSPYPGNINQLIFAVAPYVRVLERTGVSTCTVAACSGCGRVFR